MNKEFEIRSATLSADEENQKLVGYAVKWNSPSQVLYCDFVESFAPKAFSDSLASGEDVRALFEHDYTKLLGRTSSGTLKLEEDSIGLRFELSPPDTTTGKDLLVSVSRGDITGMSFGFRAMEEEWKFDVEPYQRTVIKAELFEVTVTSIPAYPESSVEIAKRSMVAAKEKMEDKKILLDNIDKIHTTEMGVDRIKRNLKIDTADVVEYCKNKVLDKNCNIYKQGKNWYCEVENIKITINSYSYTIITAHIVK